MNEERAKTFYEKADMLLSQAGDELTKPAEDVVTYSACISSRSALYFFLACYYVSKAEEEVDENLEKGKIPIDDLVDFAEEVNDEISEIDFSPMHCSCKDVRQIVINEEIYFCNNVEVVKTCANLAEKVKAIVVDDIYEGVAPESGQA